MLLTDLVIPDGVTEVSAAFARDTCITSVTIPNSVTTIGSSAFEYCTGLTSVTIPNSVTSIGEDAFYNCTGLASVTIGNSVTSIGNYAFSSCDGLKSVRVEAQTPPQCGNSCFSGFPKNIPVYVPCGTKEAYKNSTGWSSFTNIIDHEYSAIIQPSANGLAEIVSYTCDNDELTIRATANEHYHFTQWSDGNTDNPRTFVVFQDTTLTAEFAIDQHTISADAEYGRVEGVGVYDYGSTALLMAVANEHYHFEHWSDDNTDNPRTVLVESEATYSAIFAPNQYTISAQAEHGRVEGTGEYDYGTTATLTTIANEHYHFTRWSDGNTDNPRTVLVEGNATYAAEFAENQYTVMVTCDVQQGSVFGGGTYVYGFQVTLGAIPNSGYEFKQWSNGMTYNPYRFTVVSDLTLEAQFIPATAIDNTAADTDTTPQKVLIDGQVLILRNGKTYTITGVEAK